MSDLVGPPSPDTTPTSFLQSFANMADDFGSWLSNPTMNNFVSFSDNSAASAVTLPNAPAEIGGAVSDAVSGAVQDTVSKMIPYAIGGTLLIVLLKRTKAL